MEALNRMFFRPPGGMYREFHAVKTYIEPKDLGLYRRLLPQALDMPDRPAVMVFVADYLRVEAVLMRAYREAGVSLHCLFRGEPGWCLLTMPVTSRMALWLGRSAGFPKFIPEQMELVGRARDWRAPDWCVQIRHRGVEALSFEFLPGASGPLPAWKKDWLERPTFFHDDVHLPLPDGRVRTVHLVHAVPPRTSLTPGTACVRTNAHEPWAGLIEQGASVPGVHCELTGGMNLVTDHPR